MPVMLIRNWHLPIVALTLTLVLGLGLAPAAPNGETDDVTGVWINPKESVAVEVERCAGRLCGRIVWIDEPRNADGELKRDRHNPDPQRRDALLCGLRILGGFKPDGDGSWRDGWVYNPDEGKTYHGRLTLQGEDRLEVRGYVLVPLFGRSQTWQRVEQPLGGCGRPLPGSGSAEDG